MTSLRTNPPVASGSSNAAPADLHEVTGLVRIVTPAEWITLAVLLVLLGVAALWAYRAWKRRQLRLAQPPPPPPPLPPHERARRRLEAALQLLGDPNAFCTEVSLILRGYLEDRFGWNAPDRTTEEFLAELRSRPKLDVGHQATLEVFLTRCDAVKFARYEPTENELRDLHRAAARLVEDTVPTLPIPVVEPAKDAFPSAPRSPGS